MLTDSQLHNAAAWVAKTAPIDDRADVYQEAWKRYCRSRPRTFGVAVEWAKQARADIRHRNQRQQAIHELELRSTEADPTARAAMQHERLSGVPPEIAQLALRIQGRPNGETGAARVKLHRWRKAHAR